MDFNLPQQESIVDSDFESHSLDRRLSSVQSEAQTYHIHNTIVRYEDEQKSLDQSSQYAESLQSKVRNEGTVQKRIHGVDPISRIHYLPNIISLQQLHPIGDSESMNPHTPQNISIANDASSHSMSQFKELLFHMNAAEEKSENKSMFLELGLDDLYSKDDEQQIPEDTEKLYLKSLREVTGGQSYPLALLQMHDQEWLLKEYNLYKDNYPCLFIRRVLFLVIGAISIVCHKIVKTHVFSVIMLGLTLTNLILVIDKHREESFYQIALMIGYMIEIVVRFFGSGTFNFFKDFWNIYDASILVLYCLYIFDQIPMDFSTFRVIRIPFFLGLAYHKLNIMLLSLHEAIKFLAETLLIMFIFCSFFALVCLHLFQDMLKYKCMNLRHGIFLASQCGYSTCLSDSICLKEPNKQPFDFFFETFFSSLGQVMRTITANDFTDTMYILMQTIHPFTCIIFMLMFFTVGIFCLFLLISILKTQYTETCAEFEENTYEDTTQDPEGETINLYLLKSIGIYKYLTDSIGEYATSAENCMNRSFNMVPDSPNSVTEIPLPEVFIPKAKQTAALSSRDAYRLKQLHLMLQKRYSMQSWISTALFPAHTLQHRIRKFSLTLKDQMQSRKETTAYYQFSEADFLSLKVVLKAQINYKPSCEENEILQGKSLMKNDDQQEHRNIVRGVQGTKLKHIYKVEIEPKNEIHRSVTSRVPLIKSNRGEHWYSVNLNKDESDESSVEESGMSPVYQKVAVKINEVSPRKSVFLQYSNKDEDEDEYIAQYIWLGHKQYFYRDVQQLIDSDCQNPTIEDWQPDQIYENIHITDITVGTIYYHNWSGEDALNLTLFKTKLIFYSLNNYNPFLWQKGLLGVLHNIHYAIYQIMENKHTQLVFDICIFLNTLSIAFEPQVGPAPSQVLNIMLDCQLILELLVKFRTKKLIVSDVSSFLETMLVVLIFIELILLGTSNGQQSYFEVLKLMKTFLIYRVLKYNDFAVKMCKITISVASDFFSFTIIIFFLILNFAVFGMQLYKGKFNDNSIHAQLMKFERLDESWMSIFSISFIDGWYIGIYVLAMKYADRILSYIFIFALILLIDFLALGLLIAIVLERFQQDLLESLAGETFELDMYDEDYNDEQINERAMTRQKTKRGSRQNATMLATLGLKNYKQQNSSKIDRIETVRFNGHDHKSFKYFEKGESKYSLFIWGQDSRIRRLFYRCVITRSYRYLTFLVHLVSIGTMIYQSSTKQDQGAQTLQVVLNVTLFIMGLMEIITFGLLNDNNAYFQDFWKIVDFIYTISFILFNVFPCKQLQFICHLGYFRPLKIINLIPSLRQECIALYQSLPQLINISLVLLLCWIVFAIFGMNFYKGKMGYCGEPNNLNVNKEHCLEKGEEWIITHHNFEDIFEGLSTLFILASLDAWPELLYIYQNSDIEQRGPNWMANKWFTYIFLICFILFGALFFLNYFSGILYVNFQKHKDQLKNPDLTHDQMLFQEVTKTILKEVPQYSDPPLTFLRKFAQQITSHWMYIHIQQLNILVNISVLAQFYYSGTDQNLLSQLNIAHHLCSSLLIIDCILKISTFHFTRYLGYLWRKIELCIAIAAFIDIAFDWKFSWVAMMAKTSIDDPLFVYLRLFFLVRDLRIVLTIQWFLGLQRLLYVIRFSSKELGNILLLFALFISVYSFIGVELYSEIQEGEVIDSMMNFQTFFKAFLTLFRCSTKNIWRFVFTDCTHHNPRCHHDPRNCGQSIGISTLYFFSFMLIASHILLNLFILALVEQFEGFYTSQNNVVHTYIEQIDRFRNVWCRYSFEFKGAKMHSKLLSKFLLDMREPLGSQQGDNVWDAAKYASRFKIKRDEQGYIFFRSLLYEVFHVAYSSSLYSRSSLKGVQLMKQHDKQTRLNLFQSTNSESRKSTVQLRRQYKRGTFNLLQEQLYIYMVLKAWKTYTLEYLQKAAQAPEIQAYSEDEIDFGEERIEEQEGKHVVTMCIEPEEPEVETLNKYKSVGQQSHKLEFFNRVMHEKGQGIIFKPCRKNQI